MKSQQPAVPDLAQSLTALGGIGRIKADKYKIAFGVNDIEGLLRLLPKRYRPAPIVVKVKNSLKSTANSCKLPEKFIRLAFFVWVISVTS